MNVNMTLTTAQLVLLHKLVDRAREDADTSQWLKDTTPTLRDEHGDLVDVEVALAMLDKQLGKWVPR